MADEKNQPGSGGQKLDAKSCAPACIVLFLTPVTFLVVIVALALFIFLGGVGSWLSGSQQGQTNSTGRTGGAEEGGGIGACTWSEVSQDPPGTNLASVTFPIWKYVSPN